MLYAVNLVRTITQQGTVFVEAPNELAAMAGTHQELVTDVFNVYGYVREWDEVDDAEAEVRVDSAEERPEEHGWILPDFTVEDASEGYA